MLYNTNIVIYDVVYLYYCMSIFSKVDLAIQQALPEVAFTRTKASRQTGSRGMGSERERERERRRGLVSSLV